MRRPPDQLLKLVLAAFVLLGGLPRFEVRHRHEGGRVPHRHGHEDDHGRNPHGLAAVSHHGEDHHTHAESHGHSLRASFPLDDPDSRLSEGEDWHVHAAWLGGLLGDGLPAPDRGEPNSRSAVVSDAGQFAAVPARSGLASGLSDLALLRCLHGPPCLGPADSAPHHLRTLPDLRPSPPLCDAARHERSGVQLI